MKRTFSTSRLLIMGILATGFTGACDDMLDLEPQQNIVTESAFEGPKNVQAALAGAYDRFSSGNFMGGYMGVYSDLLGNNGDMGFSGTFAAMRNAFNRAMTANDNLVLVPWQSGFSLINSTNELMAGADSVFTIKPTNTAEVNTQNENLRAGYKAHARFLRGAAQFELVRMYAKAYNDGDPSVNPGIPLVTDKTVDDDTLKTFKARSSVQAVFDAALADLKYARANLGRGSVSLTLKENASNGIATVRGVNAYLARVYLTMSAHAAPTEGGAAISAADSALKYSNLALTGNPALVGRYSDLFTFTTLSAEDVFGLTVTVADGVNNFITFYSGLSRRDITVNTAWLNRFEATTDARREQNVTWWVYRGRRHTKKWDLINDADVKIIRLAEVYLTRAEASLRLATPDTAQARADIDRIRTRAGRPVFAVQFPTLPVTLEAVRLERYRELSFEGHFLHDVKRFQLTIGTTSAPILWNANRLVMPIPIREIETNRLLTQNPGYGS